MKTLETIKNTFAQEQGYEDWADLYRRAGYYDETNFFKHEDAVFILAQKAALENIKKNVSEFIESDLTVDDIFIDDYVNIISKITNPENLIR